jgi:hypothetical protein
VVGIAGLFWVTGALVALASQQAWTLRYDQNKHKL